MEKTQLERRHFKRLKFDEKSIAQFDSYTIEVRLLDLSPKGALIDFGNAVGFLRMNDKMILSFRPGNSVSMLQFEGEVVHINDNLARIEFLPIGSCSN
jgi:hypothetical protein